MTTQYVPDGFSTVRELSDLASDYGLHCGSTDRLLRFAIEIQRRAAAHTALDRMVKNAEEIGLYEAPKCWCQTCRPITLTDMRMVLCPTCGNKRCPHANDHRNECTGSNEPGQPGSAYPLAREAVNGNN